MKILVSGKTGQVGWRLERILPAVGESIAVGRDTLDIVDDQVGATWARSIAEATAAMLRDEDRARASAGVYNLSALGSVSRYDFARRIFELAPASRAPRLARIKTIDYPLPASRPLNSTLDNTKILDTFPVRLDDWETQLRACLRCLAADPQAEALAR